ncbi:hypothetical protein AKJ41_02380 [candidate division MSBL1 archaeon SCGC-AAA259O05]|uniref:Tyr recombinase domain-containing protein n=1 Tax=candidate division MSBL1 archaeon SCGC-AAA259O05 TaxID=1698271 RepID=A0A133V480_9EURY|nr:hypothetical protein AKJ41_02380 [candidate division MSBL1 archaeon SCGC-AAA259O05]
MVDVESFEEFRQWVSGKSRQTRSHYKSSLRKFCEFHGMSPRELVAEAREGPDEGSEAPWLEERAADRRLKEWHEHLVEEGDVSRNSAATYWRHIKSFYKEFGVEISADTPKGGRENSRPELDAEDVKRMADAAPSLRDRAMIWVGFQAGMNPAEVCRLDVGDVERQLEGGGCPICIEKTRKKTYRDHETWIHREAAEALRNYLAERERKEGELDPGDPLFVKHSVRKGDRRLTEDIVRKVMREVRDRVGEDIEKVRDRLDQQTNPLAFKFLRRAFGIACDNADVPSKYKDYWLGHAPPYNGAYQGLTKKKQREKYQQLAAEINPSTTRPGADERLLESVEEVVEEKFGEVGAEKVMPEIKNRLEELDSRISKVEEQKKRIEELEEEVKDFREWKKEVKSQDYWGNVLAKKARVMEKTGKLERGEQSKE